MYQQKFIKLSSVNKTSNNFTTYFNQNLTIPPNSSIALANANIELNDGFIEISNEYANNSITYSNVSTEPNKTLNFITHDCTINNGKYTLDSLASEFTKSLNSRLYFSGANNQGFRYENDGGSEFRLSYDKTKLKFNLTYAARTLAQQVPFISDTMYLGNPVQYTYSFPNPATSGILTRTGGTINSITNDNFGYSSTIFTHGSGIIPLTDGTPASFYSIPLLATAQNVLQPNGVNIPIANFSLANYPDNSVVNVMYNGTYYTYTLVTRANDGTNITSITLNPIVPAPNIPNGGNATLFLTDSTNLQGFCFGLLRASDSGSINIFNVMQYGIMILPSDNNMIDPVTNAPFIGGIVYTKYGDQNWKNTGKRYTGNGKSLCFVLGRIEDVNGYNSAGMNDYKLRIMSMNSTIAQLTPIENVFLSENYDYDDYIFTFATLKNGGIINGITFSNSKIANSKEVGKYYTDLNPELIENKSIDLYNDNNLGYTPNSANRYIFINFKNQITADMFGFLTNQDFIMEDQVGIRPNKISTFESRYSIGPNWSLPSDFNISIPNLDIESYLNGSKSSIIYSLGHQIVNSRYFSFTPPEMIFLSFKNISPISLNSLTIRMEDDEGNLTVEQANSSVTLCIRTYVK